MTSEIETTLTWRWPQKYRLSQNDNNLKMETTSKQRRLRKWSQPRKWRRPRETEGIQKPPPDKKHYCALLYLFETFWLFLNPNAQIYIKRWKMVRTNRIKERGNSWILIKMWRHQIQGSNTNCNCTEIGISNENKNRVKRTTQNQSRDVEADKADNSNDK